MKLSVNLVLAALFSATLATAVFAAPPTSVRVVSTRTGHLGQQPSEQIVLQLAGGTEFVQLYPDGTRQVPNPNDTQNCCFRVPEKYVLVITDVDWQYTNGIPNQLQTLRIFVNNLKRPTVRTFPYQSTITLNEAGQGGTSQSMTSGFVMSSKARLGYDVVPGGGRIQTIVLRGYLANDK